jgi:hypothetical protein
MFHAFQFLQDRGYPHPEHAQEVLQIILDAGITDPTVQLAAMLHDAVDYTDATNQEIALQFGSEVEQITSELFHDLDNPKSNLLEGIVQKAPTYSDPAASILLADFIASAKVQNFKQDKDYLNRLVLVAIRDCVSGIPQPNLALKERLDSALRNIYVHFKYPENESQQDVWDEMKNAAEGPPHKDS